MFKADQKGQINTYKRLMIEKDKLGEQELLIRSQDKNLRYAYNQSIEKIYDQIDLKGYTGEEAVQQTERRLKETQRCLNER